MTLGPERRGVTLPGAGGPRRRRWVCWTVLAALLLSLVAGAATFDPRTVEPAGLASGDAATHLMLGLSLAHDLDLTYGPEDYERFAETWGRPPEGLRLRSRDAGEHIAYDVPVPYGFALAPLALLAPVRGAVLANALLLTLAAVAAASVLERRLGMTAPLWVAAFVFASMTFTYVFRIGPELFALVSVVGAFAVAYRREGPPARAFTEIYSGTLPGEESGRGPVRWIVVGALLGLATAQHPFYLVLALPLALAAPRGRRRLGAAALILAALAVLVLAAAVGRSAGDDWLPWSQAGRVFVSETGFPAVDTPVAAWPEERVVEGAGSGLAAWLPGGEPQPRSEVGLWGWNLLFLVVGRAVGIVPYFLPGLLALTALPTGRSGGGRWAIPWAVAAALVLFVLVRPFDFAGVEDGPANRWFLPLYGALWFAAARPVRAGWALGAAVVAAPFLYPSWLAPRTVAGPAALAEGRYVSPVAERVLPHESSQRSVPGVDEVQHGVLWIRMLTPGIESSRGGERLLVDPTRGGELLVASPLPLGGLRLGFGPGAPTQATLEDAELQRTTLTADGGVLLAVTPGGPDRTHPVWWTRGDVFLYRLRLGFPQGEAEALDGTPLPLKIVPLYEDDGSPTP